MTRLLPDGWTVAYLIVAGFFLVGWTEPGVMAALFWASIAVANESLARMEGEK